VLDRSALAQRLATRAIALARSRVQAQQAAVVLRSFARGDGMALQLAQARCLAAVDQRPADQAARDAVDLLSAALSNSS
jgi:hypothetical protein